jgi:hypothetical protein
MSRFGLLVIAVALVPWAVEAAPPKIAGASITSEDRARINVTFDGGVLESGVVRPESWFVLLSTTTDLAQVQISSVVVTGCSKDTVARSSGPCPAGDAVVTLALLMPQPAPTDLRAIEVVYRGSLGPMSKTFKMDEAIKSILAGAKKDDADIAFAGSIVRSGGTSKYNIDSFAGYMHRLGNSQYLGAYGQAKSKDAQNTDPQAFQIFAVWRHVLGSGEFKGPFQGAIANALAGVEFSKKGNQRNYVFSPRLVLPFRLTTGTLGLISPGFTTPNGTLQVGVEVVKPRESTVNDLSVRYRGLIGSTFVAGARVQKPALYGVAFKALYEVRVLSDEEAFLDPRHAAVDPATGKKGDAPLEAGRQPRHHAEASFSYLFAEFAGVEVKYEYGSVPPAFALSDHTLTLNVALTLKQTSYARSAILKP